LPESDVGDSCFLCKKAGKTEQSKYQNENGACYNCFLHSFPMPSGE